MPPNRGDLTKMNLKHLLLSAAAIVIATPAYADITFVNKDTGGIGEDNILFNQGDTGTTIMGTINGSSPTTSVSFSSLTGQTLFAQGNGQAILQAEPNPGTTLMTSIDMKAQPGTAWTDFIIDLDDAGGPCGGGQNTCGVAQILAKDDMGQTFNITLQNGTNFVTGTAGLNSSNVQEFITEVQVTEFSAGTNPFGWTDFKQPRVSGLCTVVDAATGSCTPIKIVPEPSALASLATGLLLLGGFGWWYRRQS